MTGHAIDWTQQPASDLLLLRGLLRELADEYHARPDRDFTPADARLLLGLLRLLADR